MKAHIFKKDGSWWLDAKFEDGRLTFARFDSREGACLALCQMVSTCAKAMGAAA